MEEQIRTVDVGDLAFRVRVAGPEDGVPVLLLHGYPQTARAWAPVVPALVAAGHRVIAPDQRGYSPGASPEAVEAYAFDAVVADAVGLLDALGADRAHVVGHDWGGAVAWQVAGRHPERVRSVAVLQTPHPTAFARDLRRSWQAKLRFSYAMLLRIRGSERVLGAGGGALLRLALRASGLPRGADLVTDADRLRTAQNWYRAFSGRALAGLPDVTVPALFVFGVRDPVFMETTAEATAAHCTGPYAYRPIRDAGHWIVDTHAWVVADALVAHIGEHPG
ncbi:alpha/beta fold hydrolase [Euzebya sp.]|uniref:alpha/beta fold hydrolase n=1 Tax=Euzebya sp. TaxID=1971409 RepID=UPI003515AE7B